MDNPLCRPDRALGKIVTVVSAVNELQSFSDASKDDGMIADISPARTVVDAVFPFSVFTDQPRRA